MAEAISSPVFRILIIISRPLDAKDLPFIAEQWALVKGLRAVRAPVRLDFLQPPTVDQLREKILAGYEIVHFDGHGAYGVRCTCCGWIDGPGTDICSRCSAILEEMYTKGYLAFEKEDGTLDALGADELADLITTPEAPTKLIFLNACESAKGGSSGLMEALLQKGIPAVIGMKEPIPVKAATAIAGPFYAALGTGLTIGKAFEAAIPPLKNVDGKDLRGLPILDGLGRDSCLTDRRTARGVVSIEEEHLFGVPELEFVGEYIRGDPPQGRKGFLSRVLHTLLQGEKLVVLTGQGGIGKTVLASEAARRLAWRYPGGVFWRSAADTERLNLDDVFDAFTSIFGLEFRTLPLSVKRDRALDYLRGLDTASLIVICNAEKITDQNLWAFLEGIPQPSAALITTTESLDKGGSEIRIPEMEPSESRALFIREAGKNSKGWGERLTRSDRSIVGEILRILQGHPLGIELAAALVKTRSLEMIRDSLKAHPPGKISDRFDFSYLTLTESQKELLHRMAAFASSVTEEAIQTVCMHEYAKGGAYAARVTPDDLGELVRRSFVDRIEIPFKIEFEEKIPLFRYRLHPLMRQYTTIKANKAVLSEYRAKAALYFHDYADHFHEDFDKLEIERDNILAGMDWAVEQLKSAEGEMKRREAATLVLEFIRSVYEYLDARGYWNEAQLRLHQAIDAARETDDKNQLTYSIHNCGIIEQKLGDYSEAYRLFLQILKLGDKIEVAASLHELGILAYLTGNSGEAWRLHQQSLEIMRKLENKNGEAKSLHQLGLLAQDAGHYDEARELYLQSLEIKKSLGDRRGVAMSLNNLGMLAQLNDNYDLAMKLYRQSLKIKRELQDDSGVAKSLHNLGTLAQFSGNYDEARTLYLKSLEIKKKLGDKMGMAASLHQLGALAKDTGKYDEARNHYQQSLEIKKRLGDKKGMASTLALLALLDEAEGDISAALEQMKAAEAIFRDLGSPEAQKAQEDRERLEARLKK